MKIRNVISTHIFVIIFAATAFLAATASAQIEINDIDELQLIGNDAGYPLDGDYVLGNDIDASATATWNLGAGFDPIGDSSTPFTGSFSGMGYTITGLVINRSTESFVGLFGRTDAAVIQDIGLVAASIYGDDFVGALAGSMASSTDVDRCFSMGSVNGSDYVGGLIGIGSANIMNCFSTCIVTGTNNVGGLQGQHTYGDIWRCYTAGAVSGSTDVGGLIGSNVVGVFNYNHCNVDVTGVGNESHIAASNDTAEMMQETTFTGWDFTSIWGINEGSSYPFLRAFVSLVAVTVEKSAGQMDPASTLPITFDVVFAESVTGFEASDVVIGGTATGVVHSISGSGDAYVIWINDVGTDGTVSVSIPSGVCQSAASVINDASTSIDNDVMYITAPPTPIDVTINQAAGQDDPTDTLPIVFDVVFDEAVTGFDASDVNRIGYGNGCYCSRERRRCCNYTVCR